MHKKILIVSSISNYGGTRTYLANLLQYLGKKNIEISIGTENLDTVHNLLKELKIKNVQVYRLPIRPHWMTRVTPYFHLPNAIFQYISLKNLSKKINPDLILISPSGPTQFFSAFLLKTKKIFVIHSYPRAKLSLVYKITKTICPKTHQLLTVSNFSKSAIRKHWGLDSQFIYNPPMEYKEKLSNFTKRNCILTVGHLESYKDPATWIKTIREVFNTRPDFPYTFSWIGDGSQKSRIKNEIIINHLSTKCQILDSRRDLGSLYSKTLVYFQPSRVESQGIAVATAINTGIPCVVSQAGGLPEMVNDGVTGYTVQEGEYRIMAKKIIELSLDQNRLKSFAHKALKLISPTMSSSQWHNKMDDVFKEYL